MVSSNDGYIVLGAIIENVTGESDQRSENEHIFLPAGTTDTEVAAYTPAHFPGMAHGYMLVAANGQPALAGPGPGAGTGPLILRDNSDMPQIGNPSGGADSTVGDLLVFADALEDHRLLSPAMTKAVLAG
jgi:CubicO group peptidase (beta-lactamase class C family)